MRLPSWACFLGFCHRRKKSFPEVAAAPSSWAPKWTCKATSLQLRAKLQTTFSVQHNCPANFALDQPIHSHSKDPYAWKETLLSLGMSCYTVNANWYRSDQIRSDQSLSRVQLFVTPWITARQASLSITSFPKLMSIKLVMPSSHLILCRPLLLLPPIPPSIRVFSNESTLTDTVCSKSLKFSHRIR